MPGKTIDAAAEAAVVLQLIGPREVRTLSDLRAALSDIPRERVDAAVTSLVVVGLVRVTRGERIHPGEPLVRMDAIGLVGV
jgi:DNA-binding IclR family transcriptional regulator